MLKVFREQNGEEATVEIDHAGLECSIILGKYPHLQVVSFGPTIRSPHTTTERALWATAEPFWATFLFLHVILFAFHIFFRIFAIENREDTPSRQKKEKKSFVLRSTFRIFASEK